MFRPKRLSSYGFTIVEMLVVIVVIGILATITLVTYRGISQKAIDTSVISDLDSTSKRLKLFQVENSGYPIDVSKISDCPTPAAGNLCITLSSNNSFGVFYVDNTTNPQTFCLTVKNINSTKKYITQDGIITDGSCTYPFASTLVATTASRSQINLTWNTISGASSYILQRATDNAFTTNLTTLTAPAPIDTSAASTGLASSTTYYYRMGVVINGDSSSWSNTASATTTAFPAPAGLAVTSKTTTSISLSWGAVAGATGYTLERSSSPSFTSPTDINTGAGTLTATSSGLASGTYYYRVNVTDATGTSPWSGTLTATTQFIATLTTTQTWVVSAGITSILIEVYGAQGHSGTSTGCGVSGSGGAGGYSKGTLTVTPGASLYVTVGTVGSGGVGGGVDGYYAPGGNGGGASDVRYGGNALANRVIVAGGGGGGGGGYDDFAVSCYDGDPGATGGGTTGNSAPFGGTGGTQTTGYGLGVGGGGNLSAGGGGAGYYGGNGGSSSQTGGGGGSGYIGGVTGGTTSNGVQSGNGKVVLTY